MQKMMFAIFSLALAAPSRAMDQLHIHEGICYTKNSFGDIYIENLWLDIPEEQLTEKLSRFVTTLKDKVSNKGTPFLIHVPHESGHLLKYIKKVNFTLRHADDDKTEWIFKNDSSLPDPYTARVGTGIVIQYNDSLLGVEEITRPGLFDLPGGTTELGEFTRQTAARELKEETGLNIDPKKLKLMAIVNRKRANKYNANGVDAYYLADHNDITGELKPDPREIAKAFYAPTITIANQESVQNLNISPIVAILAKRLINKYVTYDHETIPDYRQWFKNKADQDPDDVMTIEFTNE